MSITENTYNNNADFDKYIFQFTKIWKKRKFVLFTILFFTLLGLLVAFLTEKKYSVNTILVPEYKSRNLNSGLSSLAAVAGLNLNDFTQSSDLSPLIYPQILNSIDFQLQLMNVPLHFKEVREPMTMLEYYSNYYSPNFLIRLKNNVSNYLSYLNSKYINSTDDKISNTNSNIIVLTKEEKNLSEYLSKMLIMNIDVKNGFISLTVSATEPLLAAEIADYSLKLIQDFIISVKTKKSKADLDFIKERYLIAKNKMQQSQFSYARSIDKTKFLTTNVDQISTNRESTNFSINNAVFLELAKQLEHAQIDVTRDTPVFSVIHPVVVPTESSSISRKMVLLLFMFFGLIFGIAIIFASEYFEKIKLKDKLNNIRINSTFKT